MNAYRIIEHFSGTVIAEKTHKSDGLAKRWINALIQCGACGSIPITLQRRTMSAAEAAKIPPFANGEKYQPWQTI